MYRFDGSYDLFDVFKDYFSTYNTKGSNSQYAVEDVPNTNKKTIFIEMARDVGPRMLEGVIRTGDYGYETPIVNRQRKKLSYTRNTEDTELFPLYFLLYVPQKGDVPFEKMGIAVFERFRKKGLKGDFINHFSGYFEQRFKDYRVEMISIAPEEIISSFDNGIIKKVQLISHSPPKDLADYYSTNDKDKGKLVLALEGGSFLRKFFEKIKKIMKHDLPVKEIMESDWISPDEIKVLVKINGEEKTFTIKDEDTEITPGIDISGSVKIGADGFPIKSSLHDEAVKYLELLKSYLKP